MKYIVRIIKDGLVKSTPETIISGTPSDEDVVISIKINKNDSASTVVVRDVKENTQEVIIQ